MNLLNLPIYQCFVSPALCRHLFTAGLTTNTPYHYKVHGNQAQLFTYNFDQDDYYAEGDKLADAACPPDCILPAYQVKDVEKILPDYFLSRHQNKYELSVDSLYGLPTTSDERLPDAFAKMALTALKKRAVSITQSNNLLTA